MFDNIHKFDRVFCIFTGDSINSISPDIWNKLEGECTIGINHTFKIFDKPTYFFFSDKDVLHAYWQYYKDKKYRPITYCRDRANYPARKCCKEYPNPVPKAWYDSHIDEEWTIAEMNKIVDKTWNITPIWLLATLRNINYRGKIYLIGADFIVNSDENGNPKYHFQNYLPDYYKKRNLQDKMKHYMTFFEKPFWDVLKIFNCNYNSLLRKFPFADLGEIL